MVFSLFTKYIFTNFPPFDIDKIQQLAIDKGIEEDDFDSLNEEIDLLIEEKEVLNYATNNLYLGGLSLTIAIFFYIISIHIALDKLFFKKFFEEPKYFVAARRSLIISTTFISILFLNLNGVDRNTLLGILALAILIEFIFGYLLSQNKTSSQEVEPL
ncbi:MAG: hypothetical protein Q9M76_04610 [Candidatus Dojkabacteria bacterium]|nr:hypothetical protein [Candidatus Dojkabacteria bacterium]